MKTESARKSTRNPNNMREYETFPSLVHEAALSFLVGRVLTIFFKKNFSFNKEHFKIILRDVLPMGVLYGFSSRFVLGFYALPFEAIVLLYTVSHLPDETIKTLALSFSFYLALFVDFSEPTCAAQALVVATTQFLRMPSSLKRKLREFRVVCGPVYVVAVLAWSRFAPIENFSSNPLSVVYALSPAICAVSAALLFRPDNSQMLGLALPQVWIPGSAKRTFIHGGLMFTSAVLLMAKVYGVKGVYGVATGFGTINVCLYLALKCS